MASDDCAWKVIHLVDYDYWHIASVDHGVIDPEDELGRLVVAACKNFFAQLESK